MKAFLQVIVVLLLSSPVFASDVTITATPSGVINKTEPNWTQTVTVGWSGAASADSIRAFALVLTTDSGMNLDNIGGFMRGESNATSKGYGVFPGKFRQYVDVLSPRQSDWLTDSNYNPIAPATDYNSGGYSNTPRLVVELGTLYQGDANAPGTSGTLFTIDVNAENWFPGHSVDCNMCIALEQTRGGVIKKDGTAATVTLPGTNGCFKIGICITVAPNCIGMTPSQCGSLLTPLGYVIGPEVNSPPSTSITTVGRIVTQNPPPGTLGCGSVVTLGVVSYPVKATSSFYANWVTNGKPACWAYPRQCHGDADGKKQGPYWVGSNDLAILRIAYNKTTPPGGGICADFDHKKSGPYWVSSSDLAILRAYYNQPNVPLCGNTSTTADPNYWYFCVPTGSPCDAGQTCAPAGICPNTP